MFIGKRAGLVGWVLLAVALLFGTVFFGLMGAQHASNLDAECTISYGVLCFAWDTNESIERPSEMMNDDGGSTDGVEERDD